MTPEQFTYWLQGFMEIGNPKTLSEEQVKIIQDHLNLVFNKVTPVHSDDKCNCGPNTSCWKCLLVKPFNIPNPYKSICPNSNGYCSDPQCPLHGGLKTPQILC